MLQASVASQLLVRTFKQELPVVVVPNKFIVAPLQASDAVGAVNEGTVAVHSIVMFDPALPIVGPCVSTRVMVCVTVAL